MSNNIVKIYYPLIDNIISLLKHPTMGFNYYVDQLQTYLNSTSDYHWSLNHVDDKDIYEYLFVPTRYDSGPTLLIKHDGISPSYQTYQSQNLDHSVKIIMVNEASDPEELTVSTRYYMAALNNVFIKNPTINLGNGSTVIECIVDSVDCDEPDIKDLKEQGPRFGQIDLSIETQEDF